ncbi:vomeronasal type-2 receptor 26 [Xenopus laevis]|nr:vomeronasal type-2 receptor 26 [Xenopus laevis]
MPIVLKAKHSRHSCDLSSDISPYSYSRDGDIIFGGIMQIFVYAAGGNQDFSQKPDPVSCFVPSLQFLRHLIVFIYAVEEINNSAEILPNITLGFQIYDSCISEVVALMSTFSILSERPEPILNFICQKRQKTVAFIGHMLSSATHTIAGITQLYGYPQVSYGALGPMFNDRVRFPAIYRTVPNEYSQFKAIIQLLTHFEWTWVGIIISDDDSNLQASEELSKQMRQSGICVSFLERTPKPTESNGEGILKVINVIKRASARVIILYCSTEAFIYLQSKLKGVRKVTWISSVTFNFITDFPSETNLHAFTTFNGSLAISLHSEEIPGFEGFFSEATLGNMPGNTFIEDYWLFNHGCPNVSLDSRGNQCLKETYKKNILMLEGKYRITYTTYMAVYALAHALHDMHSSTSLLTNLPNVFSGKIRMKLNHYLRNVHLRTSSGGVFRFDENGNIPGIFDILNWNVFENGTITRTQVGSFLISRVPQLLIDDSKITWNPHFHETPFSMCSIPCSYGFRIAHQIGQAPCCFDCIPCSDGEIANKTNMENCWICPEDKWPNPKKDKCIQRTIDFVSYGSMLGDTLSSIASISLVITVAVLFVFVKFRRSPIVRANDRTLSYILLLSIMLSFLCSFLFIGYPVKVTCMLRQVAFGFIFTVAVSSVLGKTVTIIIAFNAIKPNSTFKKWIGTRISIALVFLISFGELCICIIWLVCSPPFVDTDTKSVVGTIIIQCNEGSFAAFYAMISYIGILALFSFILAFIVRTLPASFNDAQCITFSMLVFCSVWTSFIPIYLSSKGKYVVAVEIFTILTSTGGLLLCIFAPKCYIILVQPELNSRRHLLKAELHTFHLKL